MKVVKLYLYCKEGVAKRISFGIGPRLEREVELRKEILGIGIQTLKGHIDRQREKRSASADWVGGTTCYRVGNAI